MSQSAMPQQSTANMEDPEEFAAWALVSAPGLTPASAPLTIPGPLGRALSKHLWELGFRHHAKLQEKKFQRPVRGQQHALNNASMWVSMDEAEPEPIIIQDPQGMTRQELEAVKARLAEMGELPVVEVKPDVAEVLE